MFEIRDDEDLRAVFASLDEIIRVLLERSANNHIMKHEVEVMGICVDSLRSKCFPVPPAPNFYPLPGTVFAVVGSCTPYVVVDRDPMISVSPHSITFNNYLNGMCEFPNWLKGVRDGGVEIVWCSRVGKVISNEVWLKSWGLS